MPEREPRNTTQLGRCGDRPVRQAQYANIELRAEANCGNRPFV